MKLYGFLFTTITFLLFLNAYGEKSGRPGKILNRAVLFKISLDIQDRYFRYAAGQHRSHNSEYVKIYQGINALLAKKTAPDRTGKKQLFHEKKWQTCWQEILESRHSPWKMKTITQKYGIPDYTEIGEKVFFNPLIFLPLRPTTVENVKDVHLLWDWFYTAILLDDETLLEQVKPFFFQALARFPRDLKIFKNLYLMSQGKNASPTYDRKSIAHFYLISGISNAVPLLPQEQYQKLREIKKHYDVNYFKQEGVIVNRFTLDNRFYMWLAAREAELVGDMDKAYVYLKTTFDNNILTDVKNFHPNHQVYLYATVRLALQLHSPGMYRYALGALDPLTKFYPGKNIEILKIQLLQLID